jgi:hypothetical protein
VLVFPENCLGQDIREEYLAQHYFSQSAAKVRGPAGRLIPPPLLFVKIHKSPRPQKRPSPARYLLNFMDFLFFVNEVSSYRKFLLKSDKGGVNA